MITNQSQVQDSLCCIFSRYTIAIIYFMWLLLSTQDAVASFPAKMHHKDTVLETKVAYSWNNQPTPATKITRQQTLLLRILFTEEREDKPDRRLRRKDQSTLAFVLALTSSLPLAAIEIWLASLALIGLILFVVMNATAFGMGIAALRNRNRRRALAIAAIILSGYALYLICAILFGL